MPFLAAPVAAGATALTGFAAFLQSGTILAGITKLGLGLAATTLLNLGLSQMSQQPSQSVQIETTYAAAPPRSVILGTIGTPGRQVFRNFTGKGNRVVWDVFELCDWRVSNVGRIRYNGEWSTPTPAADGFYYYAGTQRIQGRLHAGLPGQAADPDLPARSNPPGRWTADHRGDGIANVVVYNALHSEDLPRPWDQFWEPTGWYLYDWRKDSTVGGSGGDRFGDPSTWTGRRDNPVLQMYGLERGFWLNGVLMVGKGINPARLPLAQWTVAANICDELVEGDYRYKSALIARRGKGVTHADNMQPLLAACAASWVPDATGEYPIVGANQAVVATITDADLMPDEDFRFSRYRPRAELTNQIAGQYCDPDNFYEPSPYATKIDAAAQAADGEILEAPIDYSAVTDPKCVDRLSDIALRANRFQANADICVKPKFIRVKPGQWIRWNSELYGDRNFVVMRKRLGPLGPTSCRNVYWQLQEVGNGVFDPTEFVTTSPDLVAQGSPDYQVALDDFAVIPITLVNDAGVERSAFRISWSTPLEDTSVTTIELEYWPKGQPDNKLSKPIDANAGTALISENIAPSTINDDARYVFRYRLLADPPRSPVWSAEYEENAVTAAETSVSVGLSELKPGLYELLRRIRSDMDDYQALLEQVASASAQIGEQSASRQTTLAARDDALAGVIQEEIASITGPDGALTAMAALINSVQASVGSVSADGLFRITAVAGSGDVVVRGVAQFRATIDDVWVSAGYAIEAGFVGGDPGQPFSRFVVNADKFIVTDGTAEGYPLVFEDGELKLQVAVIGTAIIEQLRSANDKLIITGSGSDAKIEIIT